MDDVYLLDLIGGISAALDYISPTVTGHHRRVGIASAVMGETLGLTKAETTDLLMAGLLHDIGAFSLNYSLDGLDFDSDLTEHAVVGHRLLRGHPALGRSANMVLHHHTPWRDLQDADDGQANGPYFLSNVLGLMDRVDILGKIGTRVFERERIRDVVSSYSNVFYSSDAIEAFMDASVESAFWERIEDPQGSVRDVLASGIDDTQIPKEQLLRFSRFFSHIIDFRSRHTATHSQGVAETAVYLAKLAGMSRNDQEMMRLAGNLHDIGKLAVPATLLDKPAALEADEYQVVQTHASVCEDVFGSIPGLEVVAHWACQHHERVNGGGYPNGLDGGSLSLGSRIMAVADVFTAISEDRPYRAGMKRPEVLAVLQGLADDGELDAGLVDLLVNHFEAIDVRRRAVQARALEEFKRFASS